MKNTRAIAIINTIQYLLPPKKIKKIKIKKNIIRLDIDIVMLNYIGNPMKQQVKS